MNYFSEVFSIFYDKLKEACERKNRTVTAICKELGIGTANGTYWKNGSIPNGELLIKISELLEVSTDYLLGTSDDPTPPSTKKESPTIDKAEAFVIAIRDRIGREPTPEEMNLLDGVIDSLCKSFNGKGK